VDMFRASRVTLGATAGLVLAGCGGVGDLPELSDVTGYVQLDGQPVAAAQVTFQPEGGRPSTGFTDKDGYYELSYSRGETGAKVGRHTVQISTFVAPDEEQAGAPERIPARFNMKSELIREVAAEDNDISFDLTTR